MSARNHFSGTHRGPQHLSMRRCADKVAPCGSFMHTAFNPEPKTMDSHLKTRPGLLFYKACVIITPHVYSMRGNC